MFKRLDICLTGPICDCKNYNLALIFQIDVNNQIQLAVKCKTCHEIMPISRKEISENTIVSLDEPYRASVPQRKNRYHSKVITRDDTRFLASLKISPIGQTDDHDTHGAD